MSDDPPGLVFDPKELVPRPWQEIAEAGPLRTFNPAILANGDGWLFAYRFVAADGLRRIGLCQLDRGLRVAAGSQLPLSEGFRFRDDTPYPDVVKSWFADPRLYRFGGRLFVYWNSGWHEPQNHQFVHELDPRTLSPVGTARELVLRGAERRKLEKNWTLFSDAGGDIFAVYSAVPHRILRCDIGGFGDVACHDFAQSTWELSHYPATHGGLRGGAPPVRIGGRSVSFCHSVHDGPTGYQYAAAAYEFSAEAPFRPLAGPKSALPLHNPFGETRVHGRLNPAVAEVIYPCGAAWDGKRWLISHGINDEHCAISVLSDVALAATLSSNP